MDHGRDETVLAGSDEHARSTAGAMVLRALFELAGEPPYSTVRERSELSGVSLSKATITNLLAGRGSPRPRTVRAFVDACVQLKPKKVAWPAGRHTAREWLDAYDIACGRTPTARTSAEVRARPVRVGLPPVTAEALQPRTRLTELLGSVIDEGKTAVLTQPARVLSGLGGVGKSQLAAHYAGQQWHDPATDVIVWATATSTSGIVEAYAEAAIRVLGAGTGDAEQDARRFLRWAASTPKRWLIVLDDIQTPGDLAAWRPPVTATGQTVITTRYRGDAFDRGDIELIQVDVFTQEESRAYLHQRLDAHPHLLSGNDNYNDNSRHRPRARRPCHGVGVPAVGTGAGDRVHGQRDHLGRQLPSARPRPTTAPGRAGPRQGRTSRRPPGHGRRHVEPVDPTGERDGPGGSRVAAAADRVPVGTDRHSGGRVHRGSRRQLSRRGTRPRTGRPDHPPRSRCPAPLQPRHARPRPSRARRHHSQSRATCHSRRRPGCAATTVGPRRPRLRRRRRHVRHLARGGHRQRHRRPPAHQRRRAHFP